MERHQKRKFVVKIPSVNLINLDTYKSIKFKLAVIIEEIVLKPNTTPRRSNVAETTAVIHPADPTGHPRVSLRRSLIKPVETFTTPSRDVPVCCTFIA